MYKKYVHILLTFLIASIWLINGLFCKVFNLVPRHQQIVGEIVSNDYSRELTLMIGVSEVIMVIWIISNYRSKLNAIIQIAIVSIMNIIEFMIASDLLLWGKLNIVFAALFVFIVYVNEFKFNPKIQ
ncbi:MAG: DoxX-like family protein [Tenacibaculum sp.]|uniref:DoxX-like family protein n=1 Tax=Tenacibaculum TaxID=104267 RepID=UPI000F592B2F|nr:MULTISPECIES: DoxX-like family protein [Tenacibaculum]NVK09379.1 DoxX-like family protein [Tenacibaculum sp.]